MLTRCDDQLITVSLPIPRGEPFKYNIILLICYFQDTLGIFLSPLVGFFYRSFYGYSYSKQTTCTALICFYPLMIRLILVLRVIKPARGDHSENSSLWGIQGQSIAESWQLTKKCVELFTLLSKNLTLKPKGTPFSEEAGEESSSVIKKRLRFVCSKRQNKRKTYFIWTQMKKTENRPRSGLMF